MAGINTIGYVAVQYGFDRLIFKCIYDVVSVCVCVKKSEFFNFHQQKLTKWFAIQKERQVLQSMPQ